MTLDRYSDRYAFEMGTEPWTDADFEEIALLFEQTDPTTFPPPTGLNAYYDIEAGESPDYPEHIRRWEKEGLRE